MRSLFQKKAKIFLILAVSPILLTGCSLGPIKLVEKIPVKAKAIDKNYGKLKNQEAPKEKEVEIKSEEIEYNENEEIVSVVDGIQFKKAKFTISPAIEGVEYRTKPKDGQGKRVAMKTYLSVVGISINNDIYMIKVEGSYYFIDIDKTQKEEEYDKEQERKRIEEEKKREEELKKQEAKKKEEQEKKAKEEKERADKEKAEAEKKKQNQSKPKSNNNSNNSSSTPKINNNSSRSSSNSNNSGSSSSNNSYMPQPSYSQPSTSSSSGSYTQPQQSSNSSSMPESNILYPRNPSNVDVIAGINFASERFTAKVISEADMNSEPHDAIAGSNSFTVGTLPFGATVEVLGIGENGWIRVNGPGGRVVFVHGSCLER